MLFSLPLAVFVIIVSYAGLFIPETYAKETPNWQAQAFGQDIINLFLITPLLLITSWFAYKKSRVALLVWSGLLVYLIYTFVLFCFAVHFNYLFIIYCFTLGFAFYAFLCFLFSQINKPITSWYSEKIPAKTIGIYLIIVAGLFYLLWLSEILPAILSDTTPSTIIETGLITNPVHALDLSVTLPGLMIVAILLLKRKSLGLLLVPAALTFCILMEITIGSLVIVMNIRGLEISFSLAGIMGCIALITLVLLILFLRSLKIRETGE